MIKAASRWLAPNMVRFTVEYTEVKDGETWVHYQNIQGQKFSCLEAAFLDRFVQDLTS
jgi:aminoglycoside phosphotransferase